MVLMMVTRCLVGAFQTTMLELQCANVSVLCVIEGVMCSLAIVGICTRCRGGAAATVPVFFTVFACFLFAVFVSQDDPLGNHYGAAHLLKAVVVCCRPDMQVNDPDATVA